MSKGRELLVSFWRLVAGLWTVARKALVKPKNRYRIVVYNRGEAPTVRRDWYCDLREALGATAKAYALFSADRAVLEQLVSGRWEAIAEAPDPATAHDEQ